MAKDHKKIKLNGLAFVNAFLSDFKGRTATKRCLCIPVDDNHIFLTNTGKAYIDLVAFEGDQPSQYGDTHMVKLSRTKNMTDEEARELPIIGNLAPLQSQQAAAAPAAPTTYPTPTPGDAVPSGDNSEQPAGDLPF